MGKEIERKYLVHQDRWDAHLKGSGIPYQQGYLLNTAEKIVRVRTAGSKGFITIKGPVSGITRTEFEYDIPLQDAQDLLQQFCESVIHKIRHTLEHDGKAWEVDVFQGNNEGLIVSEIELQSEDEIVVLPNWVDKEVSDDPRYFNSYLAEHPFKEWKE